jgi:hypothetical protein
MMRLAEVERDEAAKASQDVEAILLKAVHDLAASLGVEPPQAIRALSMVIRRRTAFERLRRSCEPLRNVHR